MIPATDPWAEARAIILVAVLVAIAAAILWRQRSRLGSPAAPGAPRFAAWLRWLAPGASDASLRVVQSTRLTGRASVHVLRWDDREWLIGCTDHEVTLLAQRPRPGDGRAASQGPGQTAVRGAPGTSDDARRTGGGG